MRRRRSAKVKIDTKLIMDVSGAALLVNNLPKLISSVVALDPMISKVAAVGATYLIGSMLKRPIISNAGIAVGVVELLDPYISQLLPGSPTVQIQPSGAPLPPVGIPAPNSISDYFRLNDYTSNPNKVMGSNSYRSSY